MNTIRPPIQLPEEEESHSQTTTASSSLKWWEDFWTLPSLTIGSSLASHSSSENDIELESVKYPLQDNRYHSFILKAIRNAPSPKAQFPPEEEVYDKLYPL